MININWRQQTAAPHYLRIAVSTAWLLVVVLSMGLLPLPAYAGANTVPVRVGGSTEVDACPSWAVVSGLKANGDGFLTVRSGPSVNDTALDQFEEGHGFYLCSHSKDGRWASIVYPRAGQAQGACKVSSAIAQSRVYRGACKSGWVDIRWVKVIAG